MLTRPTIIRLLTGITFGFVAGVVLHQAVNLKSLPPGNMKAQVGSSVIMGYGPVINSPGNCTCVLFVNGAYGDLASCQTFIDNEPECHPSSSSFSSSAGFCCTAIGNCVMQGQGFTCDGPAGTWSTYQDCVNAGTCGGASSSDSSCPNWCQNTVSGGGSCCAPSDSCDPNTGSCIPASSSSSSSQCCDMTGSTPTCQ